jgi:hypothetical protein
MVGALAEVDVGSVCSVFVDASFTSQDVDVLIMVRTSKMRRPNHDLPVSIPMPRFGRPLGHSARYTNHQIRANDSWVVQSHLEGPSNIVYQMARERVRYQL